LKFRGIRLAMIVSLFVSAVPLHSVRAQINSCGLDISPHIVSPASDTSFVFNITNFNDNPIQWLRVTSPLGQHITLESAAASSWQSDLQGNVATFSVGSLNHGYSQGFVVQALADNSIGSQAPWIVQISDNSDGSNAFTCGGDLSLTFEQQPTNPSNIEIVNLRATNLGSSRITILWDTNVPSTSQVSYGEDIGYGRVSPLSNELKVIHSVTLTGLTPNTGYHYSVTSATPADGGTSTSSDNTFLTPEYIAPPITPVSTIPGSNIAPNVPSAVIKAVPTETVPPTVSISSDLTKPFKQAPAIAGRAGDNDALARVQYSVDGGKDWLPVDQVTAAGKAATSLKDVTFSFTPVIADDGDYQIVVRATDTSGNMASTAPVKLIIDRLPPQVGELVTSFGPEILQPDAHDATTLVAGADYRLTTSSVGGATSITIQAHRRTTEKVAASFALARSQDTGLWSGVMDFGQSGIFVLEADSFDGAGNHTTRPLGTVTVMPAGRAVDASGKHIDGARVTLYYLEPSTRTWVVWDGAPYSQSNPQTSKKGSFSLMVPTGKYYLEATAPGYTRTLTQSFDITTPTSLTSDITLAKAPQLNVGPLHLTLPTITFTQAPYTLGSIHFQTVADTRIGSKLADFTLPKLSGGQQRSIDLNGRPTVLSLVNLWSPASSDQLAALATLQQNPDIGVVPVFIQENAALVNTYLHTAGLSLSGLADPDGLLVNAAGIGSGPKHIFLDRSGHVKKIMIGVMSAAELKTQLGGL
jgi:hypothetical protein